MSLEKAVIATTRFGFGARYGELKNIKSGPKEWLEMQLKSPPDSKYFEDLPSSKGVFSIIVKMSTAGHKDMHRRFFETTNGINNDAIYARTLSAIDSDNPFYEKLVHFWSNHFTVSTFTTQLKSFWMKLLAGAFEREAIRPNITGSFKNLLLAVEQHPAMLFYLDNVHSVGKNSIAGKGHSDETLNENLAREILELHTLGVNGGYEQEDVVALANIITGWRVNRNPASRGSGFIFENGVHEPGDKILLGKKYAQDGKFEGIKALSDLAEHPSTAKFIAKKLATHFISDRPSAKTIDHLAGVFQSTDGDLLKLSLALLDLSESWETDKNKIKNPGEYIISTARATGSKDSKHRKFLLNGLEYLGQYPFKAFSPAGYSDKSSDWLSTEAVMRRVEWAKDAGEKFTIQVSPIELANDISGSSLSKKNYYHYKKR